VGCSRGGTVTHLDLGGGESEHEDLGADVAGDAEVDAVVHHGVADEVLRVGLEHVEAVDDDAGLEHPGAVRRLLEPGHGRHPERHPVVHDVERGGAVPDAHLVGVHGGEEQRDVEGEVRAAGRGGRRRRGHEQVLHGHLVQVQLRLAGLHHQHHDEGHRQCQQRQEDEQQEEAAAAAAEGGGPAAAVPVVLPALRVRGPRVVAVAMVLAVGSGRRHGRRTGVGWMGGLDFLEPTGAFVAKPRGKFGEVKCGAAVTELCQEPRSGGGAYVVSA
jgi:hypothetical protein